MDCHELKFHGSLLKRGFWLYVWRINHQGKNLFYVGRTGDNSSRFASSPFVRVGRHLDDKPHATANTLHRNLVKRGIDPSTCSFEFFCVGPVFPEQGTIEDHNRHRDLVSKIEGALAAHFEGFGEVIGKRPKAQGHDVKQLQKIVRELEKKMGYGP